MTDSHIRPEPNCVGKIRVFRSVVEVTYSVPPFVHRSEYYPLPPPRNAYSVIRFSGGLFVISFPYSVPLLRRRNQFRLHSFVVQITTPTTTTQCVFWGVIRHSVPLFRSVPSSKEPIPSPLFVVQDYYHPPPPHPTPYTHKPNNNPKE